MDAVLAEVQFFGGPCDGERWVRMDDLPTAIERMWQGQTHIYELAVLDTDRQRTPPTFMLFVWEGPV